MLRIYRAPNGRTYQYEEGEQPDGLVPVDEEPEAAPKRRASANKRRTAKDKEAGDGRQ